MSDKSMLATLLSMVGSAPVTQLRTDYSERARALGRSETTTAAEIHAFFAEITALTDEDASSFVRQLVNPKFTRTYT